MRYIALFENFDADVKTIHPYLDVLNKIMPEAQVMDAPIKSPKGYEGDVYFTFKNADETFDTVQLDNGKILLYKDVENLKAEEAGIDISVEEFEKYLTEKNGK